MDGKRAVAALALTFVVSCGGASPAATGGAGASAGTGTNSSAGTQTGAPRAEPVTPTPAAPQLTQFLAAAKLTQYKVSYTLVMSGAGAGFAGEQSWYFKPPRARYDFGMDMGGGQKTTISFFSIPEGTFYCFASAGATQCLGLPAVGSPLDQNLAASFQASMLEHPDQYNGTFTGTKTIAGQRGFCYDVKGSVVIPTALSAGTFCYNKDGIALLSQFSTGGSLWSMEATTVSTTVPDSDFTLPAKPLSP